MNNIIIPDRISTRIYETSNNEIIAYIYDERCHLSYIIKGEGAKIRRLIFENYKSEYIKTFAKKNGYYDELNDFINELRSPGLLTGDKKNSLNSSVIDTGNFKQEIQFYDKIKDRYVKNNFMCRLFIELTSNCNLNCIHCCNKKSNRELSFIQVKKVINEAYELGVINITLSGGECTLNKDFLKIAEYIREKRLQLEFYTNGQLLYDDKNLFYKIPDLYPHCISLSLYSMDSNIHDSIIGIKGSHYKKIMHNISFNDYNGFKIWFRYYLLKYIPEFLYPFAVSYFHKKKLHRKINLKNPKTFTDKLNYLKLYDFTNKKTVLTNKFSAKLIIENNFPELKTAEIFQCCHTFDEIDFSKCPESFIIKTNHACKTGICINNKNYVTKEQWQKYREYFKKVLNINYAYWGILELQYKDILPVIYVEELLISNNKNYDIREYEVYCFNGKIEFIEYVCRYGINKKTRVFLDKNFQIADFALFHQMPYFGTNLPFELPNKDKIIKYSGLLSKEFKFVRVDFFEVNDILYFGEMTFTPHCGTLKFEPEKYDLILGQKLKID